MQLNVNCRAAIVFADKLESMSKTALPRTVKETLSRAALNVKQKTMPAESGRSFTNRKKNFFKANSSVTFAAMGSINSMQSEVGFIESKLVGSKNYAVKDLEQQEYGGAIGGKSFIPLDPARSGSSYEKSVRPNLRLSKIKIVNSRNRKGKNKKIKFINAALAAGPKGFVLGSEMNGQNMVWRVDSIGAANKMKLTPIYDYSKGRKVRVKSTGFMRRASNESASQLNDLFVSEAKKNIDRMLGL